MEQYDDRLHREIYKRRKKQNEKHLRYHNLHQMELYSTDI